MVLILVVSLLVSYVTLISGNHQNGNNGIIKSVNQKQSWDRERLVQIRQVNNGGSILEKLSQRMQRIRQGNGNQWQQNRTNRLANQNFRRTTTGVANQNLGRPFQANRLTNQNREQSNQPRSLVYQGAQQRNRANGLAQSGSRAIGLVVQSGAQTNILANHIVQPANQLIKLTLQQHRSTQRPVTQRNNQVDNFRYQQANRRSWFSRHNGNTRIPGRIQFIESGNTRTNLQISRQ